MEQNMQYLYEYQNGKRVRNIGFMKVEKQMDKCMIQIHARQIDDVKGILFQKDNGDKYIGGWEAEMLPVEDSGQNMQTISQVSEPRQPQQQPELQPQPSQEPELQAQPQQPQQPFTRPMPEVGTQNQATTNNAVMRRSEVEEYIPPRNVTYEKIQRQDISRLPRKEWRLANNSFLLHGFYNYHHLLYIEDEGTIWIGVPGIYHEKEKTAANAFGFTDFRRLTDVNIDLQENERNTYEDFGYWCRQIPIS